MRPFTFTNKEKSGMIQITLYAHSAEKAKEIMKVIVEADHDQFTLDNEEEPIVINTEGILIQALKEIIHRRKSEGWDTECCALLAEQVLKKVEELKA